MAYLRPAGRERLLGASFAKHLAVAGWDGGGGAVAGACWPRNRAGGAAEALSAAQRARRGRGEHYMALSIDHSPLASHHIAVDYSS